MKHITLSDWDDFASRLPKELARIGHGAPVIARNFALVSFRGKNQEIEHDSLSYVLQNGTDRDDTSDFWNVADFDVEHDKSPSGKSPSEIIYAYTLDASTAPYTVDHDMPGQSIDITENLSEHEGLIIYDPAKLIRASKNEYWFEGAPLNAALLLFTLA